MTKVKTPNICDLCSKPITTEEAYSVDFSKKNSVKGSFIKAKFKADIGHDCFMKYFVKQGGYSPEWVTLKKNQDTGKWEES